nr:lysophospholipid acyltransferase family protein [uncultured Holophaga sp.]
MRSALRIARVLGLTVARGLVSCVREPRARDLSAWSAGVLEALRVDIELEGKLPEGGQLWVANHLSWIDPLALLSLRPAQVLAKSEVAGYPVIGRLAQRHGLRFVRRESLASRTVALRGLEGAMVAGDPLLLFPEGTTTRGGRLAPLYRGGVAAAFQLGVPMLPIRLMSPDPWYPWVGDDDLLPHLKNLAKAPRTRLKVLPGGLMHPADFADEAAWLASVRSILGEAS